jgi:hypothetical protein
LLLDPSLSLLFSFSTTTTWVSIARHLPNLMNTALGMTWHDLARLGTSWLDFLVVDLFHD